jgi:hypothetical protein
MSHYEQHTLGRTPVRLNIHCAQTAYLEVPSLSTLLIARDAKRSSLHEDWISWHSAVVGQKLHVTRRYLMLSQLVAHASSSIVIYLSVHLECYY